MVQYRRHKIAGGTYFFTVTIHDRQSKLLIEQIDLLRNAFRRTKQENYFKTKAFVILPDHLHTVWKLPEDDSNYSMRWRKIKSYFTQALIQRGIILIKNHHREYQVWQRRFWEHTIQNDTDLEKHINYIHYNPLKHGYVNDLSQWPNSSFHWYVKEGLLKSHWASEIIGKVNTGFGE